MVWHLRRNPSTKLKNILTIGVFDGHTFVREDITKLAKTYASIHCRGRFSNLQRHSQRCAQGKTVVECPAEKFEAQPTVFKKAFFPKSNASAESLRWLGKEARRRKTHIYHAMCGHGGEWWIVGAPVGGYQPKTKIIFQYDGCYWHGCRRCSRMTVEQSSITKTKHDKFASLQSKNEQKNFEKRVTAGVVV